MNQSLIISKFYAPKKGKSCSTMLAVLLWWNRKNNARFLDGQVLPTEELTQSKNAHYPLFGQVLYDLINSLYEY